MVLDMRHGSRVKKGKRNKGRKEGRQGVRVNRQTFGRQLNRFQVRLSVRMLYFEKVKRRFQIRY